MQEAHYGGFIRTTHALTPDQMVVLLKLGALYLKKPHAKRKGWIEFSHTLIDGKLRFKCTALDNPHFIDVFTAELWLTREETCLVEFFIPHGTEDRLLDNRLTVRFYKNRGETGTYESSDPAVTHATIDSLNLLPSVNWVTPEK
ncbi:MAG: hypothetical protein AAB472_02975 [Patescibacteria group bacterium]